MRIHNVNLIEISLGELKELDSMTRVMIYDELTKLYTVCYADGKCPGKMKVPKQLSEYPVSVNYRYFLMPFGELPRM